MKDKVKTMLVWSVLMIGVLGNASNDNPIKTAKMELKDSETFVLYVQTYSGDVQVQIKDLQGVVLYKERLRQGHSYKKTYDISELPKSSYYVNVSDLNSIRLYLVKGSSIELIEEIKRHSFTRRKAIVNALEL